LAKVALLLGVLGTFMLGSAGHCQAQGKGKSDAYSRVIQDALVEFDAGNYGEARALFEQAHVLKPSARTLRGMGMASFELKEYVRSEQELNAALIDLRQPLSDAQRKEALALLLRLEHYIGKLHVRTDPAKASVALDGVRVASAEFKADLGRHELSVEAPGYRTLTRSVSVEGGKTQVLDLKLTSVDAEASPPPPVSPQQVSLATPPPAGTESDSAESGSVFETWWFWTVLGVVAAGGVTAAVILSSKSKTEPPVAGNTGPAIQVLKWSAP
jgi:hypothetical protein